MRNAASLHPLRVGVCSLGAVLAIAVPANAAGWRLEPISDSQGVVELHDLSFDAHGRGLLSWDGALSSRNPPAFGALASRDPGGGWLRPPDLAGVNPDNARIHLFGETRALLVAREPDSVTTQRRLLVATGQSDGGFGPLTPLGDYAREYWSAANSAGDIVVAWSIDRTEFIRVADRSAGEPFSDARDLAIGSTAAVAVNSRGDRLLAWHGNRRLGARTKAGGGGDWTRGTEFGPRMARGPLRLAALFTRAGRAVVTWGAPGRPCGVSVRLASGRWRTRTLERRCGPSATGSLRPPVLAVADSRGATYAVWTGRDRRGRNAVKLTRVGPGATRRALVLSRQRNAVLDDVAAGAKRSLAITWTAPAPTRARPYAFAAYAAVRRGGGAFGGAARLTPPNVVVTRGTRVAFHPLSGEPVVAVPFLVGSLVAVCAAVGPAAG